MENWPSIYGIQIVVKMGWLTFFHEITITTFILDYYDTDYYTFINSRKK
jgi:hypothetical protein